MTVFLQNLLYCSAFMSVLTLWFILLNSFFGSKHSAKQRYYSFLVLLIGFLTPIKLEPFGSAVTVVTYEYSGGFEVGSVTGLNIWRLLFWVWFIGFSVCIVRDIIKHAEFMGSAERLSNDVTNKNIVKISDEIRSDRGIKKEVKLKVFPLIASPMIVGLISPTLFLPHEDYTNEQALLILSHEYVHLKRKDALYKAFIQLLKAVHWFNPIVRFVIASAIERECEISCDEEVSKNLSDDMKRLYCDVIFEAAKCSSEVRTVFSTNFSSGANALKKRFKAILSADIKKRIMISGFVAAVLMLISGALIEFSVIEIDSPHYLSETTVTDHAGQEYNTALNESYNYTATTMTDVSEQVPGNFDEDSGSIMITNIAFAESVFENPDNENSRLSATTTVTGDN